MRGRIVSLADGSRHLVVGTHAHAARGRMIELLPLDGGGPRIEVGRDEASLVRDQTGKGRGTLLRALLANRRAQEQGGGGDCAAFAGDIRPTRAEARRFVLDYRFWCTRRCVAQGHAALQL